MDHVILVHKDFLNSTLANDIKPEQYNLLQSIIAFTSNYQGNNIPLSYFTSQYDSQITTMNQLVAVADPLRSQLAVCRHSSVDGREFNFSLFDIEYDYTGEKIRILFNPNLEYILRGYAMPDALIDISYEGITSMYLKTAKFLYTCFSAYKATGEARISVGELKYALGIPDTVKSNIIKTKYLVPAIECLEPYFGMITMRPIKQQRSIIAYVFSFDVSGRLPGFETVLEMRNYPHLKEYINSKQYMADREIAAKMVGEKDTEEFLIYNYKEMVDEAVQRAESNFDPAKQAPSYRKKAMEMNVGSFLGEKEIETRESEKRERPSYQERFKPAGIKGTCGYDLYYIPKKDGSFFLGHPKEQQDEIEKETGRRCMEGHSSVDAAKQALSLISSQESMNSSSGIALIKPFFQYIRGRNEEEKKRREEEVLKADERYSDVIRMVSKASPLIGKRIMARSETDKSEIEMEYRQLMDQAMELKNEILRSLGRPADYLEPIYLCEECRDQGYDPATGDKCIHWQQHIEDAIEWDNKRGHS